MSRPAAGPRRTDATAPRPGAPLPRGRRAGSAGTREAIVGAARAAFAERGFTGASVRDIAARAGVDPALVHHYFGTKQRLFVAVMQLPVDPLAVVPGLLGGGSGTGTDLVRFVVTLWDRPEVRPVLEGVIRSAVTDEAAAEMVRAMLAEGPLLALAREVRLPDAEVRAALAGAQLVGLAVARYVVRVEPIASMTPDEVARRVGPAVDASLFGALPPAGEAAPPARPVR